MSIANERVPLATHLGVDDVHLWQVDLDAAPDEVQALAATLEPEERFRAEAFRLCRDRHRFVVAHGALRTILGRYAGVDACRLRLERSPRGKPALAGGVTALDLRFNLAHSDGLALCAVTVGREVGVDVERIVPFESDLDLAEQFFGGGEATALGAAPDAMRPHWFARCWTRMEALHKATGAGIVLGVERDDRPGWSVRTLEPRPGYLAAVAAPGETWELTCWIWKGLAHDLK